MKQFAKYTWVPESFILENLGEHASHELKQFCRKNGTPLKVLEEGTSWENLFELYVGIMKEVVSEYVKEVDSSLELWDYFIERLSRVHNLEARNLF